MKPNFRIGSTSYVYADDIVPNVRRLAGMVEDIELVLFEVDDYGTNLPNSAAVAELNALARANELTFTVHLPLDLRFEDSCSFGQARRAIDATCALDPQAFVLHLDGRVLANRPLAETIEKWEGEASSALSQIVKWVGDASRVCVENVEGWDPSYFRDLVTRAGASRCVDIGHLWLQQRDPLPHLMESLSRTRVIHLHGIGSRDHRSLRYMPLEKLQAVVDMLLRENYGGVVTLEVFGMDDFFSSLAAFQDALDRSEWK